MRWVSSIAQEILGLFVEDGSFAIAIAIWLLLTLALFPRLIALASWGAPVLFAGLAAVLAKSVLNYSRKGRK